MDLGAVFDEHVATEFVEKDVDATTRTMVKELYVWHVPVLTGGVGGDAVRQFYATELIGHTPADAVLRPIARTVANDRVIDEFVLEFTHEGELPFMLPASLPPAAACGSRRRGHGLRGRAGGLRAHLLGPGIGCSCRSACSIPLRFRCPAPGGRPIARANRRGTTARWRGLTRVHVRRAQVGGRSGHDAISCQGRGGVAGPSATRATVQPDGSTS